MNRNEISVISPHLTQWWRAQVRRITGILHTLTAQVNSSLYALNVHWSGVHLGCAVAELYAPRQCRGCIVGELISTRQIPGVIPPSVGLSDRAQRVIEFTTGTRFLAAFRLERGFFAIATRKFVDSEDTAGLGERKTEWLVHKMYWLPVPG